MATAIQPGDVIDGKYRVVRRIGEGGMGTVYEGENVRIERRVAIKVLHEQVASSVEFAQRFEREARASARIGSPHVCDVLDLGDLPNGERFIVMEYLDGESLEDRLAKGKLTAEQLAPIAFEILEGLGAMHQVGVIHRDLKPANVFLARGPSRRVDVVKILDFGVAKILPRADEPSDMTSTGMMMGTPLYMSPEQARGARDVDGRTDLYAASVIFYRALTGEMPHSGLNLHELLFKIVLEDPRPIIEHVPDVDEAFATLVTKGLARDADHRYLSAREYQEEIAAWGATQGRSSLQFAVTLPSEPPPLRISGGFPAAAIAAKKATSTSPPITGPARRDENKIGPPTPALAKTQGTQSQQVKDSVKSPVATTTVEAAPTTKRVGGSDAAHAQSEPNQPAQAQAKQSGGTPIVWSDDAPEIAKRAFAELEAKKKAAAAAAAAGGAAPTVDKTEILASAPANDKVAAKGKGDPAAGARADADADPVRVPAAISPSSSPPARSMRVLIALGAVVVIAAAIVGGRMARNQDATSKANAASAASPDPVTAPSSPTPTPTPLPTPTPTPTLVVQPETTPSTTASTATTVTTPPTTTSKVAAVPTPAKTAPSGHPSATASATAVAPTAAPTSSHRKFRTNLE